MKRGPVERQLTQGSVDGRWMDRSTVDEGVRSRIGGWIGQRWIKGLSVVDGSIGMSRMDLQEAVDG